jgi:oligopeptide/dipeptide ABC transporter ATP-binding protein
MTLVDVRGFEQHFAVNAGWRGRPTVLRAVAGVDLQIGKREFVGLVGESGSGKSTLGRGIVGAVAPTRGQVSFDGVALSTSSTEEVKWLRRQMQLIFQNPLLALNPRMTVEQTLTEHLYAQKYGQAHRIAKRVSKVLDLCGLAQSHGRRRPHELSGGQRQRVLIARAIAGEARFIVADEPVSALDGSTRAQIINLFRDLHEELALTSLIISHDLSILTHLCSRIAVMYLGRIVEISSTAQFLQMPRHPYARALLDAVPVPDPVIERGRKKAVLSGDPPDPTMELPGCSFYQRCPKKTERCRLEPPLLRHLSGGSLVACHHAETLASPEILEEKS